MNDSNDQRWRASASIFCEDPFSSCLLLTQRSLNIILLIFLLIIRIFVNFIFQLIKIELKIADCCEEEAYNPNEEVYFIRLVLTKLLKVEIHDTC